MSEVTDKLGLTGRQRTSLERAWAEWRRVLGLDQAAMETFRRFMAENSSMVVDGIPPGFRMDTAVEIAVGSPMLAPMFWRNRSWVTVPDADFDRVRAAWGLRRRAHFEIIDPTRLLKRSKTTGAYEVAVLIQVFRRDGFDIQAEEAHRAWSGFWEVLGIGEENRGVMTDFLLENSSKLVDSTLLYDEQSTSHGILPPSLDDGDYGRRTGAVAEVFRRAAWRKIVGDPGLTIDPFAPTTRIPGAYDDLTRAEVQAWRRIDL